MLVHIVALLEALAYLCAVPVCVAFCVSGEGGLRAGAAAGTFNTRAALRRARRQMDRGKRRNGRPKVPVKRLLRLFRRLRFERVSVKGVLGLSDAAATALLCGAITALGAALRGRAASLEVDIAPAFDGPRAEVRGIIRARVGQIILAAIQTTGGLPHGKAPD